MLAKEESFIRSITIGPGELGWDKGPSQTRGQGMGGWVFLESCATFTLTV